MKALLLKLSGMDTEAEAALRVIAYFDALDMRSATPEMIARGAAAIGECTAGFAVQDRLPVRFDSAGERLRADSVPRQARQQNVGDLTAWLERSGGSAPLDDLILERFLLCLRSALRDYTHEPISRVTDPVALEAALSLREPLAERSLSLRRLGFSPSASVVVLAIADADSSSGNAETLVTRLARTHRAKGAALGSLSAVIVQLHDGDPEREIERIHTLICESDEMSPGGLRVGIGHAHDAVQAGLSWSESRRALRFAREGSAGTSVVTCRELGALVALTRVQSSEWSADWRVRSLAQMNGTESGRIDLAVLECYLALGSLRAAGSAMHMHHSSVAARLTRLEERLSWNLSTPADNFQARLCLVGLTLLSNEDTSDHPEAAAE